MKSLFLLFLFLLLAIIIGWGMHQDSGDVLISFKNWQVETSVWFALLLIVVAFILIYILIRLMVGISHWPQRMRISRKAVRLRRGQRYTEMAACVYIEGQWEASEKYFVKAAQYLDTPLLCYIGAALSAEAQNEYSRRDHYLQKAYGAAPNAEVPLGILQARLQIAVHQDSEAQETLDKLKTIVPNHPIIHALQNRISE
jgi:HemY protein